jgi:hypothetical protein
MSWRQFECLTHFRESTSVSWFLCILSNISHDDCLQTTLAKMKHLPRECSAAKPTTAMMISTALRHQLEDDSKQEATYTSWMHYNPIIEGVNNIRGM